MKSATTSREEFPMLGTGDHHPLAGKSPADLSRYSTSSRAFCGRLGARSCAFDGIWHGDTKEMYLGDPTHVNIQPVLYGTEQLQRRGLLFDIEAYNRFVSSPRGPTEGNPRSFFATYPCWSVWTLIKGRA